MNQLNIEKLLDIGIALSADKDADRLLRTILDAAMDLTSCDGGTLYILQGNALVFHMMVTKSMGIDKGGHGEEIALPPVPLRRENVCACAALDKVLINVSDVYHDSRFDFSGPRKYDAMTGYATASMLVVPMSDDHSNVIGVLQLINAKDDTGNITAFDSYSEHVILSLTSQAAIRLTTLNYSEAITGLLKSFVRVMSTAIDARSPYNANHTRNMARYAERFLNWLDETKNPWTMTNEEKQEFLMAVWLHDIGKLVIPLEVMDKDTRLGSRLSDVLHRFEIISLLDELAYAQGKLTKSAYQQRKDELKDASGLIQKANAPGLLTDELHAAIQTLARRTYLDRDGIEHPWLTAEEAEALSIRKGTLTLEESKIMESHITMTEKMLRQMAFINGYKKVPEWASSHHEMLDGSGYPKHSKAEEIPYEVRLLTILDIFDALTARDRPYKKAIPVQKALDILNGMAKEGKIDQNILALFQESRAWAKDGI